jgi:methyltransferase family protein
VRFSYLLSLTPLETYRLIRRRLPLLRSGPSWTAAELLSSAKHGRGIRFAELLLRQEAVARRYMPWSPIDFENKRVVEIGCGPLAGYGPLAIFCGAESFESADPEWDPGLFSSEEIADRYLRVLHADLSALYGLRMEFPAFRQNLAERIAIHRTGFEAAPLRGETDIVLSQSCLEHVFPVEGTMKKLSAIQNARTRFLHLVDFGNHYPTGNPFEGLYEQPPADYIARRGKAINLLRVSDITKLFEQFGIAARTIPARVIREGYNGKVHPWWQERYEEGSLFTQLALVTSPA